MRVNRQPLILTENPYKTVRRFHHHYWRR